MMTGEDKTPHDVSTQNEFSVFCKSIFLHFVYSRLLLWHLLILSCASFHSSRPVSSAMCPHKFLKRAHDVDYGCSSSIDSVNCSYCYLGF